MLSLTSTAEQDSTTERTLSRFVASSDSNESRMVLDPTIAKCYGGGMFRAGVVQW